LIEQLLNNVYVETGTPGANHSIVVTTEGIVILDVPHYPTTALKWRDEIAKYGPVIYIINMEPHPDHCLGNFYFNGTVIGHEGVRKFLSTQTRESYIEMLKKMDPPSVPLAQDYSPRLPSITFKYSMTLHIGNHTFQLKYAPGHTNSQIQVYVPEEKILFTADNMVKNMPRITNLALPFEWINTLEEMKKIDTDVIVPGHGSICNKSDIPKMIADIQMWLNAVYDAINKGKTLEEAQNSIDFLYKYAKSPMPPEMAAAGQKDNIANLYNLLKNKR
jgi:cyclase